MKYVEIAIIIAIALLFITGLHTQVLSGIQKLMLKTGLMTADIEVEQSEMLPASYDLKLTKLDGGYLDMNTLKGKTIFINFWATWCPPCVAEMDGIEELYKKAASDNVVFLMVSTETEKDKIKTFIQKHNYTFPVYQLGGKTPKEYAVKSIPTTFVITPYGKIATKKVGIADYDTQKFVDFLKSFNTTSERL